MSRKTVFSARFDLLRAILVEARKSAGLTQTELSERLARPQSYVSKYEIGERRLDVIEFIEVANVIGIDPCSALRKLAVNRSTDPARQRCKSILERWGITADELTELIDTVPSVRGMLMGAVAEVKLKAILESHRDVTATVKYDDHDRQKKGDRFVTFRGQEFSVESKSLQTAKNRKIGETWHGEAQVDASDRRQVIFADGTKLQTTCLLRREFPDILAVNLFSFENEWRFIFALREDLPPSRHKTYTESQRNELLATAVKVTWPPQSPFEADPFVLIELLYRRRHFSL